MDAFHQHLIANHVLVQTVLPAMQASGYGRIINVISTSVKEPIKNLGVSNTIRGAVASWAKTLAAELGPFGITVNNVLPGYTRTQRLEQIVRDLVEVAILQTRERKRKDVQARAQQAAEEQARQKEQKEELLSRRQGEAQEQRQEALEVVARRERQEQGAEAEELPQRL